jgi:hypothetical protein
MGITLVRVLAEISPAWASLMGRPVILFSPKPFPCSIQWHLKKRTISSRYWFQATYISQFLYLYWMNTSFSFLIL